MVFTLSGRNFKENYVRTAAIIITVALSSVMLFLSLIYSHTVNEEFFNNQPVEAENADIRIEYSPDSDTRIINLTPLELYLDKTDFAVGVLELYGTAEIKGDIQYIALRGIKEDGFNKINNINYYKTIGRDLKKDEVIIDRLTSVELGLDIDDSFTVKIGKIEKTFYVGKIAEEHPCFQGLGAYVVYGIESYVSEYIGSVFGRVYNKIFIKTAVGIDKDFFIEEIRSIPEYSHYSVNYEPDVTAIESQAKDISLPVMIGTFLCAFLAVLMVCLIINAGFKKRAGVISSLKSLGASESFLIKLNILECLYYILSGLILGLIINFYILKFRIPQMMEINSSDGYYVKRLFLSLILCGVMTLMMTLYPVFRQRRISVRRAYSESKNTVWKGNNITVFLSLMMIIISALLIIPSSLNPVRGIISLSLCFIGIILIIPYIIRLISNFLLRLDLRGVPFMSLNNLHSERLTASNIRIFIVGVIVSTVIMSASSITTEIAAGLINGIDTDIIVTNVRGDTDYQVEKIKDMAGVKDVFSYQYEKVDIDFGAENYHMHIIGIKPEDVEYLGSPEYYGCSTETLYKDGILIDYLYYKIFDIRQGDELAVTINGIRKNIEVSGFYHSYLYGGRTAIINRDYLAEQFGIPLYDTILLKSEGDINETVMKIRADMGVNNLIVENINEAFSLYFKIIDNTVKFADWFILIIFAVSLAGIFTNIINSREERKAVRYRMYSLGFSEKDLAAGEFIENSSGGLICSLIAFLTLFIIRNSLINILSFSKIYIVKAVDNAVFIFTALLFTVIYSLISLTSLKSVDKSDLIKILKE